MSFVLGALLVAGIASDDVREITTPTELRAELVEIQDAVPKKQERGRRWPEELRNRLSAGETVIANGYARCTHLKALELYKLSETAREIARASFASCTDWRDLRRAWTYTILQSNGLSIDGADEAMAQADSDLEEALVAFVMKVRVELADEGQKSGGN